MNETKARILDAAEKLVAEHGVDVSLRAITTEAGVNLAAVNYHFQSKEALFETLVARRFEPINTGRLQKLDALEAANPKGKLSLEDVLDAFLSPILDAAELNPGCYQPLLGRLFSLPDEQTQRLFAQNIKPIIDRFHPAFARAVPGLKQPELTWRVIFSVGAVIHVLGTHKVIAMKVGHKLGPIDLVTLKRQVIAFAAGGFRAPSPEAKGARQ